MGLKEPFENKLFAMKPMPLPTGKIFTLKFDELVVKKMTNGEAIFLLDYVYEHPETKNDKTAQKDED